MAIKALNPNLKAFAPVREWAWSREEEIDYAIKHTFQFQSITILPTLSTKNLWGRANECGFRRSYAAPPEDAFDLTTPLEQTPDKADEIIISFKKDFQFKLTVKIINSMTLFFT